MALQIDVSEQLRVSCDGNRLEQVLVNLIGNAIDAMQTSASKTLRIYTEMHEARLSLLISDSGAGMAEDLLPRLFEPFFTTKPAGQGLGLGLVISSKIVHEFGGQLRARNNPPPATGMTFEFDLALSPKESHV